MNKNKFGLPQRLDDGLVLRWATAADTDAVAEFNIRIHSDDQENLETWLGDWTKDLMSDYHPTCRADDFTVVVDENDGGKIVSTMNLISQTWSYDGLPFTVGRPELVGTDENYRRKKLVRAQFEAIHAKSAARNEMVQAITGIPWFYRQFGYEMCVNLGGSRQLFWSRLKKAKPEEEAKEEVYQWRDATVADLPILDTLYGRFCAESPLSRVRDEAQWRYELFDAHKESPYSRQIKMIENLEGHVVAYVEYKPWGNQFGLREIAVMEGVSLRGVALFACRVLQAEADKLNETRKKPIDRVRFDLGEDHSVYTALDWELGKPHPPYAWYMRVVDIPAFLLHVAPVLEKRLANSTMAGFSGKIKLNFYRAYHALVWENGRLQIIQPYEPTYVEDGDAFFPELTFLQLLFGYRSLKELNASFADCFVENADAFVLLNAIFPKRPSLLISLG